MERQIKKVPKAGEVYEEIIQYYGDYPGLAFNSPAKLSITPDELRFEAVEIAVNKDWSFTIPLEKIRRVDIKKTREITGWRMFLGSLLSTKWGPTLATIFKKERYLVWMTYEDELNLMQDLIFDTWTPDDERNSKKVAIIQNIRSAIEKLQGRERETL